MHITRPAGDYRRIAFALAAVAGLISIFATPAAAEDANSKVEAVKKYLLEEDYPELFGDKAYHMQVRDIVVGDLDGDKQDEVVLLVTPHYLESPTILIFQVDKKLRVTRVREGLAPGPVVPVNGDYLDSHKIGQAVDLTLAKDQGDPVKSRKMIEVSMKNGFGGIVEYKNFFHMDHRSGKGMYLDMRHIDLPAGVDECSNIQFSEVDAITIATRKNETGNYLLAKVGDALYAYRIKKITRDGRLEKELQVFKP